MRRGLMRFAWLASLAAAWGLHGPAQAAEGPFRRLANLFGGKEAEPVQRPGPSVGVQNGDRLTEILIEMAWLEDPLTFPYYLEARVRTGKLHLRGYVPSVQVRRHAVEVARRHTSLPVEDGFKEHPSLQVRQSKRTAAQLAEGVKTTMERALPKRGSDLKIQCTADGNVILQGTVSSFEEKLALSQALRRQPGCFRVTNLTQVLGVDTVGPNRVAQPSAPAPVQGIRPAPLPQLATSPNDAEGPGSAKQPPRQGFFQRLFDGNRKENPPVQPVSRTQPPAPRTSPTVPGSREPAAKLPVGPAQPVAPVQADPPSASAGKEPVVLETARVKQGPTLPPAQIRSVLQKKVPGLGPVQIVQGQDGKLRIETRVRNQQELESLAGRILGLPELAPYGENVELHFQVEGPKGP